jgi:transposase
LPPIPKKKRPEQEFIEKGIVLEKLKISAKDGVSHLYFFDESGMSTVPNVQRAWSPLCMPHCADASGSRKRVNILGALNYAANTLVHALHETTVKRPQVVEFIDRLAAMHVDGKPVIVVLDNASIHHNIDKKKIDEWLLDHRLILLYLTPYSPELNLIEILWKHAKYHWRKFTTWTKENLLCEVGEIFNGYGRKFEIRYT